MRVLVAGWPSLRDGEATAGDVLAMDAVAAELAAAGISRDLAWSPVLRPGRLAVEDTDPGDYTHLVFACGPLSGPGIADLHRRFAGCRRIAIGVSVPDPAAPAAVGFHAVLPRDGPGIEPVGDLSIAALRREPSRDDSHESLGAPSAGDLPGAEPPRDRAREGLGVPSAGDLSMAGPGRGPLPDRSRESLAVPSAGGAVPSAGGLPGAEPGRGLHRDRGREDSDVPSAGGLSVAGPGRESLPGWSREGLGIPSAGDLPGAESRREPPRDRSREGLGAPSAGEPGDGRTDRDMAVAGVVMVARQAEYGDQGRHERVAEGLDDWLRGCGCARIPLDTRLDPRDWRLCREPGELTAIVSRLDLVVTMRLHGLVLALARGIPVIAVDPVAGGAKVSAQARAWRWPARLEPGPDGRPDPAVLDRWRDWCLSPDGRAAAARAAAAPPATPLPSLLAALTG